MATPRPLAPARRKDSIKMRRWRFGMAAAVVLTLGVIGFLMIVLVGDVFAPQDAPPEIGESRFRLIDDEVKVATGRVDGVGTSLAAPAVMSSPYVEASMDVVPGDWVYQVTLADANGEVRPGTYQVTAFISGHEVGTLYVERPDGDSEDDGAVLTFVLGKLRPPAGSVHFSVMAVA